MGEYSIKKMSLEKRQKPDVKELLERLKCVVNSSQHSAERVLARLTRSDYFTILTRAYCLHAMQGKTAAEKVQALGSKAKAKATSSSLMQLPKNLKKLLIQCKMYKLRHACPNRELLGQVLRNTGYIEAYLEENPKEQAWWQKDEVGPPEEDGEKLFLWFIGH